MKPVSLASAELLPEGWSLLPLHSVARPRKKPNTGMRESNLLSLSYGQIIPKDINNLDGLLPESFDTYQIVEPGNIVCRFTDLQNDQRSLRTGLVQERGIITSAYTTIQPTIDSRWMHYFLRAYDQNKLFYGLGGGLRQGLKFDDIKHLPVVVPPREQQGEIAKFLDRETAQIDAMIDAQQRLVDLLDERRNSTVQRVASGRELPPDVSSETWEPRPVKAFGVSQSGAGFPLDDQGDPSQELPFYKVGSLAGADERGLLHSSGDTVDRETARRLRAAVIPPGSSVLAKIGAALLLGRIRQTSQDSCIDNNMMAFVPNSRIVPRFAYYSLQQIDTEYIVNPGAVPSLNVRAFMNTAIAVPDPETQRRVVAFLDDAVERVETLRARAESSISLLRERRAAVITAAVTGRLDPRAGVERVEAIMEGAAL